MTSVLYVINDLTTGGAQTLVENLVTHREGESHVLVLMGKGPLSSRLEVSATSVHYCGMTRRRPRIVKAARLVRSLVRELEVDVIHSHLVQSDLVALLSRSRTPIISTIHTSGGHESGVVARVLSKLVRRLSVGFDAVVACSSTAAEYASRSNFRLRRPLVTIPNGVSVPASVVLRDRVPREILCLSRWHPMKDHSTLIEAFGLAAERVGGLTLTLAGSGIHTENQDLMALIGSSFHQEDIRVLGPVSDVSTLLNDSDALVISSSWGEALPMAGIEALAHGVPVVTTDVGDSHQLGAHPGLVVPIKDPERLAAAIVAVASLSSGETANLRQACHRLALKQFNIRSAVNAYELIYLRSI